jgi:YVTN family beta-propeller protein
VVFWYRHAMCRELSVLFGAALVATACSNSSPTSEAPSVDAATPPPIMQKAFGPRLLVTNEASGDLTVMDLATRQVTATIPLGKRPRGIVVGPDRKMAYVALSGSPPAGPGVDQSTLPPPDRSADGIGVVDLDTGTLLRVLPSGPDPERLAVSLDGRWILVTNEDAALTSIVDVGEGTVVATVKVGGEPEGVDLRPDGKVVYVTSEEDGEVFVIDVATRALVTKFAVGPRPRSTAFLPDSSKAYVTSENGGSVAVVDAQAHSVLATIQLPGELVRPMGVVASPDGTHVYVTTGRGKMLVAIDTKTQTPVWSVEVGTRPWGVAISPDGSTIYTANGPSNDITVVDVATRTVVAKVKAGDKPWGAAVVP